ncbi:MAG: ribonuclease P protein component [Flavobacteriales bacterium]
MEPQTFRKSERLSSRKIITHLFEKGKATHCFPFKALWSRETAETSFPAQMCITVPKRSFKKAHERNHIKRKVKEAYRKNKSGFYSALKGQNVKISLLLIYVAKEDLSYSDIESKMITLLSQLQKDVA